MNYGTAPGRRYRQQQNNNYCAYYVHTIHTDLNWNEVKERETRSEREAEEVDIVGVCVCA